MFLYGTAELFTDSRQSTMFTSVNGHLSGIFGSARGVRCLNSFVGRPDKPKSGLTRVECTAFSKISISYMVRSPTSLEEIKNQQPGHSFMHLSSCFIWVLLGLSLTCSAPPPVCYHQKTLDIFFCRGCRLANENQFY